MLPTGARPLLAAKLRVPPTRQGAVSAVADPDRRVGTPRALRLVSRMPPVLRLFSRFMAIGVRNEHVAVRPSPTAVVRR